MTDAYADYYDPVFDAIFDEMIRVAQAKKYQRVALGGIVLPDPMCQDMRGIWPVTIPPRVMCARLLEWNDGS